MDGEALCDRCVFRNCSQVYFTKLPRVIRNSLFEKSNVFWLFEAKNKTGSFENCTFVGNPSVISFYKSTNSVVALVNCILQGGGDDSHASIDTAGSDCALVYTNCLVDAFKSTKVPYTAQGCKVGVDPQFVDAAGGDYRLRRKSPCVDSAQRLDWMAEATDLGGSARVATKGRSLAKDPSALPDIGCYENQEAPPGLILVVR